MLVTESVIEQPLPSLIQEIPALLHVDNTVGFSHCGTAIAIVYAGRPWPQLVTLSPVVREVSHVQSSARKRVADDTDDVGLPTKQLRSLQPKELHSNMDRSVALALNQIPSVLSTSSFVALQGQGSEATGNFAIISSKNHPNQINVVYGNEGAANELSICKLPRHLPLECASVDLAIRPNSHDAGSSVCTTVINSKSMSVYESDERNAAECLPVVIWKDTRALSVKPFSGRSIQTEASYSLDGGKVEATTHARYLSKDDAGTSLRTL